MRKWFLLMMALLTFGIAPVFAQTSEPNDNPLLTLLAHIPDTPSARESLSYIDYRALIAARPGIPNITSSQELLSSSRKDAILYLSTLNSVASGPDFFGRFFGFSDEMQASVGFDLFAVDRAVAYANPPEVVNILEGSFDINTVIDAHEKRGYTESKTNDLTLLCPPKGCDSGMSMDLQAINYGNPFGGELGRNQPVLVASNLIASSISLDALKLTSSVIAGQSASLADQPDYRAAAEAISANGTLIQTYLIQPVDISSVTAMLVSTRISAALVKQITAQLQADFIPVPAYNLVALADTATATEQQALVALVYTTQAKAEAAAALFPKHLQDYMSLVTHQSMSKLLEGRGVTSVDASIYPASTDRFVMVLTLHAPLPSNVIPADATMPQASSLVYALLVRAYQSRDLGWLGWLATQF